ncbi:MAG: DUF2997 domain-containing protein [Nitrospira sp.]|nr:DUF2997 domain-containing protein [Nitrospira sp.]
MSTIRVHIDKNGAVTIDVIGGQGASCSTLTKALQEALGPIHQEQIKPEFFESTQSQHETITN